jgi:hypothetical protein
MILLILTDRSGRPAKSSPESGSSLRSDPKSFGLGTEGARSSGPFHRQVTF